MSVTYCLPVFREHKQHYGKWAGTLRSHYDHGYPLPDDKEHETHDLTEECVSRRNVNYEHFLLNITFMLRFWRTDIYPIS
jgi:hypothetical protein